MGTWQGHVSTGLAFYSLGLVFCVRTSWNYLTKGRKFHGTTARRSTTTFGKILEKVKGFPLDSVMKILYGFGAAMAELFFPPGTNKLALLENGHWKHENEWQHFTMFTFFMVSGIIDIVSQRFLKKRKIVLEKAALAMAFYITALLLFYHSHGKAELELDSHKLLVYANLGICASLTLEVWRPFDQKLIWLHTLLIMQMGSWLFHLTFILFKPIGGVKWDTNDMENVMILPIFYGWHILFNCCVMAAVHIFTWTYYKYKMSSSYCRLDDSEHQCCISSQSDDCESTNGGTFPSDKIKKEMDNSKTNGYHDVVIEDETTFMSY